MQGSYLRRLISEELAIHFKEPRRLFEGKRFFHGNQEWNFIAAYP